MALVQDIVQRIQASLRDEGQASWPEEVIRQAIYEAEKVIVNFRPDAAPVDAVLTCVPGIKQSISALNPPPNRLLSVKYNRAGDTDGRSVRRVALGALDSISPDWRSKSQSTVIREFLQDEREPLVFYVSPPAATGAKLQLSYSAIPQPYEVPFDEETLTTVNDLYEPMILEWALYRLFGQDVEGSVNIGRSNQRLATFQSMMGIKIESDGKYSIKNDEYKQ